MHDAEVVLRRARRPLVLGMGGGGDVVGALATAEFARIYDAAAPLLGGLTWERSVIDPGPGPRAAEEIEAAEELAPGVLLASADAHVWHGEEQIYFAETRMAQFLGERTVLVDLHAGPAAVARGLAQAAAEFQVDLLVFVDVGGDVLAQGHERGLRSPLCDAIMLAAASRLARSGHPVLLGIFGIGCDAELTPAEVLARIADVASAGGLLGVRGLTEAVAQRLEGAVELVPTEASAQAVRAFRGASGTATIRSGARQVELSTVATVTFFLDVAATMTATGKLANAVLDTESLEEANDALHRLGVRTELDLEREAAGGRAH